MLGPEETLYCNKNKSTHSHYRERSAVAVLELHAGGVQAHLAARGAHSKRCAVGDANKLAAVATSIIELS
jgi:hypothetical protein